MVLKYLDSKRIVNLSTDIADTPTLSDDFTSSGSTSHTSSPSTVGGWLTQAHDTSYINGSTDKLHFNEDLDGNSHAISYDLGAGNVSDTNWTLRIHKFNFSTLTAGAGLLWHMGLSDSDSATTYSQNQDSMGCTFKHESSDSRFECSDGEATTMNSQEGGSANNITFATSKDYYIEIKRLTALTYTAEIFDDEFNTSILKINGVITSATGGFRYITIKNDVYDVSGGFTSTIDKIEFFNGSVSSKPTNVQDNSILVEKDTANRFWSSGYGTGGAITKDSSVNAQTATSGSTLTASLTVASNSNRIIIISLTSYIDPALVPTGITFGSQAFTKLDSYGNTDGNGSVWYLVNPNVGTDTVTATWASSIGKRGFTAYSFYNVAQTDPLSGFTTATGTGNTATGSITPTGTSSAIFSSLSWVLGGSANAHAVSTLDGAYYVYTGGKGGASSYNLTPTIGSANTMAYTSLDDNGGTSEAAQSKIGMFEIKKGASTWTNESPLTYTGNMGTDWTKTGSDFTIDTANNEVDYLNSYNNQNVYFDFQTVEALSTSAFVIRFTIKQTGTASGDSPVFWFGCSETGATASNSTATDFIGFSNHVPNGGAVLRPYQSMANDSRLDSSTVQTRLQLGGSDVNLSNNNTLYYYEIVRDGSNFTSNIYSDSGYSTLLATRTNAVPAGGEVLRYFIIANYLQGSGVTGTFGNFKWYNGVTSV